MSQLQPQAIQKLIEKILEYPVQDVKALGSGATSTAWWISCGSDEFVFRATHHTTNRPITYRSEFLILHSLYEQGLPVPEPLYTSFDHASDLDESVSAWALTHSIVGHPISRNRLTAQVAGQLGEFLRALHQLPVSDFGRLNEQSNSVQGQQNTHLSGICARWCWAKLWPYDKTSLSDHPIVRLAPDLLPSLLRVEAELWRITTQEEVVLNHSDLYGEHIFTSNEHLSGIIDFGAAFIATRGWEFAVLAHYHGWEAVEVILKSYSRNDGQYKHILHQAHHLALVVALYKLEKAVTAKREVNKQQRIVHFVTETLALLGTA